MEPRPWRQRIREYSEVTDLGPVVRRYFVIGAFDGALTILGIIVGATASGVHESEKTVVLTAAISAAIALAVSSAVGAFEAERVEKKLDIHTLERAMLTRLSEEHKGAFRFAAYTSAFAHGVAPLVAALPPIVPFLLLPFQEATLIAVILTLVFLFGMGAYLGRLVRERIAYTGLRFVAAGLLTALVLWILRGGTP
ncbi:MAG TPA: VIT1/CCC1 transporter family protein [Thermoplasmata archaeon]|nr:VIT1/CCC1 transporter family protein [Thermoplasmata archaeon]